MVDKETLPRALAVHKTKTIASGERLATIDSDAVALYTFDCANTLADGLLCAEGRHGLAFL